MSEKANFPTDRQGGVSRSPRRHDFHEDRRGRDPKDQHEMYDDGEIYESRNGSDSGASRQHGDSREPKYYSREEEDYSGMYDDTGDRDGHSRYAREYDDERRHREYGHEHNSNDFRSRTPPRRPYNRSRSRSPRRDAGRPSDTVILESVPFGISTSQLLESLVNHSIAAELPAIDVRLSSSRGTRRAFIQFQAVEDAMTFVKEHYPKVSIKLQHSTDNVPDGQFDAYLHYARNRDNRDDGYSHTSNSDNWICTSCDFANYPTRSVCKICGASPPPPVWQQNLTGETDASFDNPSQILVVYPLAPFVNEDMLAADMKRLELDRPDPIKEKSDGAPKLKSTAPTTNPSGYGARPDSLHRVFVMRDSSANESFKYGFAEFWTIEDAAAALKKFQMARNFTVAACAVNIAGTHMGVFIPEEREVTSATEHMSFCPLFNPNVRVRYRDPHLYPSQKIVTTSAPGEDKARPTEDQGDSKKSKKRKADASAGASAAKKSVPMAGTMAMWQQKRSELRGEDGAADRTEDRQESPNPEHSRFASIKTDSKGPITISLSKSTKLGSPTPSAGEASDKRIDRGSETMEDAQHAGEDANNQAAPVSFVDRDRLMCLICMRKYKSVDEVNIHEKSRNHKTATEDPALVSAAQARVAARNKKLQSKGTDKEAAEQPTSQYRDRAKERRAAFNQPQKPAAQPTKPRPEKPPQSSGDKPPAAAAAAVSKGAGMLAKMGWASGAGLGAKEDGRTDVIATNAYQERVGLGAEGANLGDAAQLAERKTKNDYAEYVNTVQDKARERYNKMD